MNDLNLWVGRGRIVDEPILKQFDGGSNLLTFRIANNRGYKDKKRCNFINCNMWGDKATNLKQYMTKGKMIELDGELVVEQYTNKNGVKGINVCVKVNNIYFLPEQKYDKPEEGQTIFEQPSDATEF